MTYVALIRPETDQIEQTLSLWADLLMPPLGLPGVSVIADLRGSTVTAAAATGALSAAEVTLYFGHGDEAALGDPAVIDATSIANASPRTVIAIACLSADTLGYDAVSAHGVREYLGFSEPLFAYNLRPAISGAEIATHLAEYLEGTITLSDAQAKITTDLQTLEKLYCSGARSHQADALMIWMGVRMNWRGLELH